MFVLWRLCFVLLVMYVKMFVLSKVMLCPSGCVSQPWFSTDIVLRPSFGVCLYICALGGLVLCPTGGHNSPGVFFEVVLCRLGAVYRDILSLELVLCS